MDEFPDRSPKPQINKEFTEKAQNFYKIHSNLPTIRQHRFNDFDAQNLTFKGKNLKIKEIHFINSKLTQKLKSSFYNDDHISQPPQKFFEKINKNLKSIDKELIFSILAYFCNFNFNR